MKLGELCRSFSFRFHLLQSAVLLHRDFTLQKKAFFLNIYGTCSYVCSDADSSASSGRTANDLVEYDSCPDFVCPGCAYYEKRDRKKRILK